MTWAAVLGCALGCYLLKLAGLCVPARLLAKPVVQRVADLVPVALLAALIATQVFAGPQRSLVVDGRAVGLGAAAVALVLRAPFLVVVFVAAAAAAAVRLA